MKKIFTLLVAVGFLTAVQAQNTSRDYGQKDQRNDDGYGKVVVVSNPSYDNDSRYDNYNHGFERKRDMEIAMINREFDYKIQRVQRNFFMSRWEKQREIRFLQEQRQREISMVYAKFGKNRNSDRFERHDHRYERNDRSNGHY